MQQDSMPASCSAVIDAMAEESPAAELVIIDNDDDDDNEVAELMENGGDEGVSSVNDDGDAPIDLKVRNVVTMFHTCSHIDLRQVTTRMCHVVYDRSKGVVEKSLRNPHACVKIWSSGKVILAGCRSEQEALLASRRIARLLQKILGPKVKFSSYRVTNIMATCRLPFNIKIDQIAREYPREASYEPELNTGLIWKSVQPKSTVRIHTTGSIIVTGALCSSDIIEVLTTLYPICLAFRGQRPPEIVNSGAEPKRNPSSNLTK